MAYDELVTPEPNQIANDKKLNTLLALFPAAELKEFYTRHSPEMLLLTAEDIERNDAITELLTLLAKRSSQNN